MSCARGTSSLSRRVTSQQGLEGEKRLRWLLSSLFFSLVLQRGMCNAGFGLPPALQSPELGCAGKGT